MSDNVDPSVFFRSVGSTEPVGAEPTEEQESTETDDQREPEETEGEELETASEGDEPEEEESSEEDEPEPEPEKADVGDDYEIDVTLDGEKTKATIAQLRDSYERHKVSTQRFQEASAMKKEAEAKVADTDKRLENVKAGVQRLGSDADYMLNYYQQYAPETLHRAFEKYAEQLQSDNALYENDPKAYQAMVNARKTKYETETERERLNREKAEVEAQRKKHEEVELNRIRQETMLMVSENLPKAMQSAGLVIKGAPKKVQTMVEDQLRQYMHDNYSEKVGVTKEYIQKCARELALDPDMKELVESYAKKADKKAEKETMETTKPNGQKKRKGWIDPSDFFSRSIK